MTPTYMLFESVVGKSETYMLESLSSSLKV